MPRRTAALALAAFVLGCAYVVQGPGFNQNAHFALVRALADGRATVDPYRAETMDVAFYRGHYYAAKAPGLSFVSLPPWLVLKAAGLRPGVAASGPTHAQIAAVWALGLWGALLPAAVLLVLVRLVADDVEPGYGTLAAVTLGLATMLLPFAQLFFDHALSACLGFAAFAVLWRERRRREPRLRLVAAAGALAGYGTTTEYPLALVALALGGYAIARKASQTWAAGQASGDESSHSRHARHGRSGRLGGTVPRGRSALARAAAYAAGAGAGIAPLLAFNAWAFGSPFHLSYANAVSSGGRSGHAELTANAPGFFGVRAPSLHVAAELLFSHIGLLTITPVVAAGAVGAVLLYRRGARAEAVVVAVLAVAFVTYNAGYATPFGGGSPGPRFLVPLLPFLAFPLALAYRAFPLTTGALALASAGLMSLMTATVATHAPDGRWDDRVRSGDFVSTLGSYAGVPRAAAIVPFFAALAVAAVLAARATRWRRPGLQDAAAAAVTVAAWAAVALAGPRVLSRSSGLALLLAAGAAAVAVAAHAARSRAASAWKSRTSPSS